MDPVTKKPQECDSEITDIASLAVKKALENSLNAGINVQVRQGSKVVALNADGSRSIVRETTPPIPAKIGKRYSVR